ncbi:MAG: hypothetical protein NT037_03675 [Hyphomicrobiales bacterium]|nr:hypothetical protein [Hyphomicrobiales bacterium]
MLRKRACGGFQFGDDGRSHKTFVLENATCAPLEVDVRLGRSRRSVTRTVHVRHLMPFTGYSSLWRHNSTSRIQSSGPDTRPYGPDATAI